MDRFERLIDEIAAYKIAFIRACMYLQAGYQDDTEKNDFTMVQWEKYILDEIGADDDIPKNVKLHNQI